MISSPQTIGSNGFSMVLWCFNHWFRWFSMFIDHWFNDVMVSMYRSPLARIQFTLVCWGRLNSVAQLRFPTHPIEEVIIFVVSRGLLRRAEGGWGGLRRTEEGWGGNLRKWSFFVTDKHTNRHFMIIYYVYHRSPPSASSSRSSSAHNGKSKGRAHPSWRAQSGKTYE